MKVSTTLFLSIALMLVSYMPSTAQESGQEWIPLFDGKTLNGWKASENPNTFSVEDGKIVVHGPRAHLFYVGSVESHDFENFEFKADVKTTEGSNSGIYFHTAYQQEGWPSQGYEVQVNNTHEDPRKTASLYAIDDIKKAPAGDNEWFTMNIRVVDRNITVKVDGKTMVEYTEGKNIDREGRVLSSGTFAIQGHDPESKVMYRNIMVKPLE